MKILTAVFSFNSSDMTKTVYDELNHEGHDLIIVDNSSSEDAVPKFGTVHQLGYDNIEFGAMIQWLMANDELINDYDFVGFLNNDIYGLGEDHIKSLHRNLSDEIGIAHWSLHPTDPNANLLRHIEGGDACRNIGFVENIAPYYNTKLIKKFRSFFPLPRYGCIDIAISDLSISNGYKNIVINETPFHHMRSGVRNLVGSINTYRSGYANDTAAWDARLSEKDISFNRNMSW